MSPPKSKDYSEAERQRKLGIPIAQIAKQYGITRQAMSQALKRREKRTRPKP